MAIEGVQIVGLLESEISRIDDEELRARVQSLLVEPALMQCAWDYGEPDTTYPCWKVAGRLPNDRVGIAYCEHGFGPKAPWGLIWLDETIPEMGQDSGWFSTFREAAADILGVLPSALDV